jgi:NAD-dependent dihydropyrimidine dehydrogenase PreA subunit
MFFRLFPCPIPVGLQRIGSPGRNSPVLVTCNFYLTVRRLIKKLHGLDAWLLVADSKGVNVWCAAGGEEFNTRSVVSAVKTSGIAEIVNHRRLILPPLGAPGIKARAVEKQTGWSVHWGPVRAQDIPQYLRQGYRWADEVKRATYNWRERLDTALGPLFPIILIGAVGFLLFSPYLLLSYLLASFASFLFFFLTCPWLPGKSGLTKIILPEFVLGSFWAGSAILDYAGSSILRVNVIMAMIMLPIFGTELGGMAATMRSDLDPFLSRLGIGAIGNLSFSGSVRTELLNETRRLTYDYNCCVGCSSCAEICPQAVWNIDGENRAVLAHIKNCTACRACLLQCQGGAIKALPVS